eukprot:scaffold647627_cov9-Prasinocladus_malaysianus.AAC.1
MRAGHAPNIGEQAHRCLVAELPKLRLEIGQRSQPKRAPNIGDLAHRYLVAKQPRHRRAISTIVAAKAPQTSATKPPDVWSASIPSIALRA